MNRGAVAGVAADVRSGSKGDIVGPFGYVRFAADSELDSDLAAGPLSAIRRHPAPQKDGSADKPLRGQ